MPHNTPFDVHVDAPGRERPDSDFDAEELERGIAKEMKEHGVDRETAKRLVKDHLSGGEHYAKSDHSREYLEAFHAHARKQLPGWIIDQVHQAAMPSAGGAAGRRAPQLSTMEQEFLRKISPEQLRDAEPESLQKLWLELEEHHKLAGKKGLDLEQYEAAAGHIADELERRGTVHLDPEGHLARAILGKAAELPEDILVMDGREVLSKAEPAKQIIWYVAAEPGVKDTYGDIITASEVEDACHRFMLGPRKVFMEHGETRGLNQGGIWPREITGKAAVVESGLAPAELGSFFGAPVPRPIPMGSWLAAVYYPDRDLWRFASTTFHGISWRGAASRESR